MVVGAKLHPRVCAAQIATGRGMSPDTTLAALIQLRHVAWWGMFLHACLQNAKAWSPLPARNSAAAKADSVTQGRAEVAHMHTACLSWVEGWVTRKWVGRIWRGCTLGLGKVGCLGRVGGGGVPDVHSGVGSCVRGEEPGGESDRDVKDNP